VANVPSKKRPKRTPLHLREHTKNLRKTKHQIGGKRNNTVEDYNLPAPQIFWKGSRSRGGGGKSNGDMVLTTCRVLKIKQARTIADNREQNL